MYLKGYGNLSFRSVKGPKKEKGFEKVEKIS